MQLIIQELVKKQILQPGSNIPKWLPDNVQYLAQVGSVAYGVSGNDSDIDVYGFCMPPKHVVFPHTAGHILGFGPKPEAFDQWQVDHLKWPEKKVEYDFTVYNIVKYFQLVAENNPNMVASLSVPPRCILHITPVGQLVRDNRKLFVHKGLKHKYAGYAFAQLNKIKNKSNASNPKRAESIAKHGFDTKAGYHVVRLVLECEQFLETGDVDLERDREILKSIRRGEWTFDQIEEYFKAKEPHLEELYNKSTLPHSPNWAELTKLLTSCLECHYGSLDAIIKKTDLPIEQLLGDLQTLIGKYQ